MGNKGEWADSQVENELGLQIITNRAVYQANWPDHPEWQKNNNFSHMKILKKRLDMFKNKELSIFLLLVVSIFVSEAIIMLTLSYMPALSIWIETILDSSLLSIFIFPVIYVFIFKPLQESIADRNKKEARYFTLIENMGEGVVISDASEKFIFANSAAEQLFGVKKGELTGVGLDNFFLGENYDMIRQKTELRKNGESDSYTTEIQLRNGEIKNVYVTATPQFEDGEFTGTLAIIRDFSALKKAEDAIKFERNLLRALIDNLPDAVYVKNKKHQKIIANPVDIKYMGLTSENEALGKTDYDIYPSEIADGSFADDSRVLETGLSLLNQENYFIDNFKEEHWMLNSKVPLKDANGEIIGLVGIGKEITERKKEEAWLKLLESVIMNATDGVSIIKIDDTDTMHYKFIFVNDAYCKITGYSMNELMGKSPSILQGEKTGSKEIQMVRENMQRFESCKTEIISYKKNGQEFWSSFAYFPIKDSNGRYKHWIAIIRDISEQKLLEENYLKAKGKAEAASKAKSEFLANMSHEIRTPLNSVIGFSDLMMKTKLDATQQQYNTAVFQSANSLLDIINEILDFSKIEAGKLEIDIHKTDMLDLSYQVSDVICYQAFKKNLELLLNIELGLPRFIWIDSIRIRQILINLMGNAVKFTPAGEIELKIETISQSSENKRVIRFSVRDTGIGINPENRQKIFNAFSQEDASTNRKYGGTGLGLSISKQLLGLMGSKLQLQSAPGMGSTFFFDLQVQTLDGEPEESTDFNQFKKMLIVDDNANNRLLIKDMLLLKDIRSDEAESGKRALELLEQNNKYDIILMDYHMPEMDGIETIRYIREELKLNESALPIILLHSSAEDEHLNAACLALDVSQRLVKPIKIKHLFEALARVGHQIRYGKIQETIQQQHIASRTESYKVLVVDDNELNILLIKKIIGEVLPNAVIIEAVNGKEAVDYYIQYQPDIIFMDIQMPGMNGYEATVEIRKIEKNKRIPIIALTAATQNKEKEASLQMGMDDFVTKPFINAAIIAIINKWL